MIKAKVGNVILNNYAGHKKADLIIKKTKEYCHVIGMYNGLNKINHSTYYTKDIERDEMFKVIGYIDIDKVVKEMLEKYFKDDKEFEVLEND